MSTSTITYPSRRALFMERAGWYLALTKPRIAVLELVTVFVAACVASSGVPAQAWVVVHALIGTALVAGSASALNQWLEREVDRQMPRTAGRPLPAGYISGVEAVCFGAVTMVAGTVYLAVLVNGLTATIGALTWLLYVFVYTPLKSRSAANTAVGAIAGALPAVMGWTAVDPSFATRESALMAAILFLIVFLWQFPHFMAIAWLYRRQYAAAGMKMLTVVDESGRRAGVQAVLAAACLVPISLFPAVMMKAGLLYFIVVLQMSVALLALASRFLLRPDDVAARWLLRASLIYLPALLALLFMAPFVFPWI